MFFLVSAESGVTTFPVILGEDMGELWSRSRLLWSTHDKWPYKLRFFVVWWVYSTDRKEFSGYLKLPLLCFLMKHTQSSVLLEQLWGGWMKGKSYCSALTLCQVSCLVAVCMDSGSSHRRGAWSPLSVCFFHHGSGVRCAQLCFLAQVFLRSVEHIPG